MSSELVGIGGVLIGLIAGFGLERLTESRRDEAPELKRVADDLHVNQVRPALNAVRLYGTPEVINDTRLAFKHLIKANRRCERGPTSSGEVDLNSYRVVFEACLQRMRGDVGSAVADERLDPGGGADLRTIDAEIDCEIAEQPVPQREPS